LGALTAEKPTRQRPPPPAPTAPSTTSPTAFIPARCPSGRGRWRSRAQRPLPSMMLATCRGGGGGPPPLGRICSSRSSDILHHHDLRFLALHQIVHLLLVIVVERLDVLLGLLLLVFRDV